MSYEPPSPPAYLPTAIVNTLNDSDPRAETERLLRTPALAPSTRNERPVSRSRQNQDAEERPDDLPDDVPAKATITIKESTTIATTTGGGEEGNSVMSKYKGPVNSDE